MKIIETDNRSDHTRRVDVLRREARLIVVPDIADAERRRIWERGFTAAMELVAASVDPEPLARGTRDWAEEPTAPYPVLDLDLVDAE